MKSNFELYISRCSDKKERELLFKKAMLSYGIDSESFFNARILKTATGKPYFKDLDVNFNISHSQDIWACLTGPGCCGLDVQYIKPCNFGKIAGRFFSCAENKYVEHNGLDGFFDIWARREAYGKYTGEGFFGRFKSFVDEQGTLKNIIGGAVLKEIKVSELEADYIMVCCIPYGVSDKMIEIKKG